MKSLLLKFSGYARRAHGMRIVLLFLAFIQMSVPAQTQEISTKSPEPKTEQGANTPTSTPGSEPGSAGVPPASAAIEIEKYDFGIVIDRSGPTKDWRLHPVVVIPNLAGVQYAWKLKTNCKLPLFVREEFTLPEPPSTWKLKEGETSSQLLKGGEQCILESFQATDDGWIGHAWTASHGDPAGKYQIKIWLNGKLAHDFVFNVGEAVKLEGEGRDW